MPLIAKAEGIGEVARYLDIPNPIPYLNGRSANVDDKTNLDWRWLSLLDDKSQARMTAAPLNKYMSSYEEFVQAINEDRNHIMLRSRDGLTAWVNQINFTMETDVFEELAKYLVEGERKEEERQQNGQKTGHPRLGRYPETEA